MNDLKKRLRSVVESLNPKVLGLNSLKIESLRHLGNGEGHLNYLALISGKKFILRVNFDKDNPDKPKHEFECLKAIEKLNVAPKAFYLHDPDMRFSQMFVILEYIEGKTLRMKRKTYSKKEVKEIARLLRKVHSYAPKIRLGKDYFAALAVAERRHMREIHKYNKSKTVTELLNAMSKEAKHLFVKHRFKRTLIHGDLVPQNFVMTKKGLRLIDWENVALSDPALDIAHLISDMKFSKKEFDVFFKVYGNKSLLARAIDYAKAFHYEYFIWEIVRVFDIIKKKLPEQYLKKTTAESHIYEAKYQFRKCIECGLVPKEFRKFDVAKIFY